MDGKGELSVGMTMSGLGRLCRPGGSGFARCEISLGSEAFSYFGSLSNIALVRQYRRWERNSDESSRYSEDPAKAAGDLFFDVIQPTN